MVVEPLLMLGLLILVLLMLLLVLVLLVLVLVGAVAVAGGRPRRADGSLQTRRQKSRRMDETKGMSRRERRRQKEHMEVSNSNDVH